MSDIIVFDPDLTAESGLHRRADVPADLLRSGEGRQWGHYYLERRDLGLVAGIWQNSVFETELVPFAGNEFFQVVAGSVEIEHEDGTVAAFGPGEAALVPHGLMHRWIQKEPARLFFAKYTAPAGSPVEPARRVVRVEALPDMPPSAAPSPDMLLTDDVPSTTERTFFKTADGRMSAGAWTATPYRRKLIAYPRFELMCLRQGSTSFPRADGSRLVVKAGETVLVCKGAEAEWWNREPVAKVAFNFFA